MTLLPWILWIVTSGAQPYDPEWRDWRPGQNFRVAEPGARPFWRKEKVREKMKSERAILVSVKVEAAPQKGVRRLHVQGAGWVEAPAQDAFVVGQDFSKHPQISEYIRSVRWRPEQGQLEMKTEAFGYRATLEMQIATGRNEGREEIRFRVIDGVFRGMTGRVSFQDIAAKQSEISLTAAYDFVKLPMPKFFLEFGLEVALQRMAGALRNHVENLAQARAKIPKRQGKEVSP